MDTKQWREDYKEFEKVTRQFYAGEVTVPQYKGFSGGFGSYAQRGGKASMLRLRLPGGRVTKEKMKFIADSIKKYQIDKVHLTTCQTIQFHNLSADTVCALAVEALECGIVTRGGGGDFPRNVMVSPLSGVEQGEYFDVTPYADKAGEYLMGLIKTVKLPRKLKVCFSNSPANVTHATFRDLGFVARSDGKFDVYSAGGLGNNPKMGVLCAEGIDGSKVLYYIKAMVKLFVTYGNYEVRAKARTRYMQDVLGEKYVEEFRKKLEEAFQEEKLDIEVSDIVYQKSGDGTVFDGEEQAGADAVGGQGMAARVIPQKQSGLYTVKYHPIGGCPSPQKLVEICEAVQSVEEAELRLAPDETLYIINCTAQEARNMLSITDDGADTLFESSVACIGASICQVGARDSQKLLQALVDAAKGWNFPDGVLPQIHISGCPSSCGTHQVGRIGFRGGMKKIDGKPEAAFLLYVNGRDEEDCARFGEEIGVILETEIPSFLKDLGSAVAESGLGFDAWYEGNADMFRKIAEPYL